MVAEMRLRRDHGPRAGMVNSVSSSIRQADPLAARSPPSHALVTPEASLYVAVIYLSPSFPLSFSLIPCHSFSFSLISRLRSATPCYTGTGTTKLNVYLLEHTSFPFLSLTCRIKALLKRQYHIYTP